MSKLYLGNIDLLKFKQSVVMDVDGKNGPVRCVVIPVESNKLYEGKKGLYADTAIWVDTEPDKYGNHVSVQLSGSKEEKGEYLGNFKEWVKKGETEDVSPTNSGLPNDDDNPFI